MVAAGHTSDNQKYYAMAGLQMQKTPKLKCQLKFTLHGHTEQGVTQPST